MGYEFNLDEVITMAEEIERNGARFYRRAAAISTDPDARKLFEDLAGWEDSHERLFKRWHQEMLTPELEAATVPDPNGDQELYLQAMAEQHVFTRNLDTEKLVDDAADVQSILSLALDFERDSILFFLGMKAMVPPHLGQDRIDRLVAEEMSHVAFLRRAQASLRGGT